MKIPELEKCRDSGLSDAPSIPATEKIPHFSPARCFTHARSGRINRGAPVAPGVFVKLKIVGKIKTVNRKLLEAGTEMTLRRITAQGL